MAELTPNMVCVRAKNETSNRVDCPASYLQTVSRILEIGSVVFLKLKSFRGKTRHVGIQEFTAGDHEIVCPSWILDQIELTNGEYVQVSLAPLPDVIGLKIRVSGEGKQKFEALKRPEEFLTELLLNIACVENGLIIHKQISGRDTLFEFVEVLPGGVGSTVRNNNAVKCEFVFSKDDNPTGSALPMGGTNDKQFQASAMHSGNSPFGNQGLKPSAQAIEKMEINDSVALDISDGNSVVKFIRLDGKQGIELCGQVQKGDCELLVTSEYSKIDEMHYQWSCIHGRKDEPMKLRILPNEYSPDGNPKTLYIRVSSFSKDGIIDLVGKELSEDKIMEIKNSGNGSESNEPEDIEGKTLCDSCGQYINNSKYNLHSLRCAQFIYTCPTCDKKIQKTQKENHCHCEDESCDMIFPCGQQEKHNFYYHRDIVCPACKVVVPVTEFWNHERDLCMERNATCQFCEVEISIKDLYEHQERCGSRTKKCEMCGEHVVLKNWEIHLMSLCRATTRTNPSSHANHSASFNSDPNRISDEDISRAISRNWKCEMCSFTNRLNGYELMCERCGDQRFPDSKCSGCGIQLKGDITRCKQCFTVSPGPFQLIKNMKEDTALQQRSMSNQRFGSRSNGNNSASAFNMNGLSNSNAFSRLLSGDQGNSNTNNDDGWTCNVCAERNAASKAKCICGNPWASQPKREEMASGEVWYCNNGHVNSNSKRDSCRMCPELGPSHHSDPSQPTAIKSSNDILTSSSEPWSCNVCTFNNRSENMICEMCQASRLPPSNSNSNSNSNETSSNRNISAETLMRNASAARLSHSNVSKPEPVQRSNTYSSTPFKYQSHSSTKSPTTGSLKGWQCKYCQRKNRAGTHKCVQCGLKRVVQKQHHGLPTGEGENPVVMKEDKKNLSRPPIRRSNSAPESNSGKWKCSSCTYLNEAENVICEMCYREKNLHAGIEDTDESNMSISATNNPPMDMEMKEDSEIDMMIDDEFVKAEQVMSNANRFFDGNVSKDLKYEHDDDDESSSWNSRSPVDSPSLVPTSRISSISSRKRTSPQIKKKERNRMKKRKPTKPDERVPSFSVLGSSYESSHTTTQQQQGKRTRRINSRSSSSTTASPIDTSPVPSTHTQRQSQRSRQQRQQQQQRRFDTSSTSTTSSRGDRHHLKRSSSRTAVGRDSNRKSSSASSSRNESPIASPFNACGLSVVGRNSNVASRKPKVGRVVQRKNEIGRKKTIVCSLCEEVNPISNTKCSLCDHDFSVKLQTYDDMDMDIDNTYSTVDEEERHECMICSKSFNTFEKLQSHIANSYQCSQKMQELMR